MQTCSGTHYPADGKPVSGNAEEIARDWLLQGCDQENTLDWAGAEESYRRALAAEPKDPFVLYFANNNLGYSLLQMGRYDEAEEYCETAVGINPEQYNAHKNLGLAREGQGRWLDAALNLAEAARLCTKNTRAWLHLQQLLARHPGILGQSAELAECVSQLKAIYRNCAQTLKPH